jgi:hypothetical protein
MSLYSDWLYQQLFANKDQQSGVIGGSMSGGAGGAMDMFGDKAPTSQNLGISNAPTSVLANQMEQQTGVPFNTVGMKGLLNVGNALSKMAPAMGLLSQQPDQKMESLKPPPSYGHYPGDNLTGILNRAGYTSPEMAELYKRMGLLGN